MQTEYLGKKVLVIDDDRKFLSALDFFLSLSGFSVTPSSNGDEGLHRAKIDQYDLVYVDAILPGWDGFNLCRTIRREMKEQNTPIILMSAYHTSEMRTENSLRENGINGYLPKPFALDDLKKQIDMVTEPSYDRQFQVGDYHMIGDLSEISLAAVMGHIYGNKDNGCLSIDLNGERHEIYFINGEPVFYLNRQRGLLPESIDDDEDATCPTRRLLMMMCEKIIALFAAPAGNYYFDRNIDFVTDIPIYEISAENLLLAGIENGFTADRVKKIIDIFGSWRLHKTSKFDEIVSRLDLAPHHWATLGLINGVLSTRDIMNIDPQRANSAFALIYALILTGAAEAQ